MLWKKHAQSLVVLLPVFCLDQFGIYVQLLEIYKHKLRPILLHKPSMNGWMLCKMNELSTGQQNVDRWIDRLTVFSFTVWQNQSFHLKVHPSIQW